MERAAQVKMQPVWWESLEHIFKILTQKRKHGSPAIIYTFYASCNEMSPFVKIIVIFRCKTLLVPFFSKNAFFGQYRTRP